MSFIRLIVAGLAHHWRMHVALALGVMAGGAVLTGALFVGDSMRGSLRDLLLDRLGRVDSLLITDRYFREELAGETARQPGFAENFTDALPAIILPCSVDQPDTGRRANEVTVVGVELQRFWKLANSEGDAYTAETVSSDEILVNAALAKELDVTPGDEVIIRLPRPNASPPEAALGRKTENVVSRRVTIAGIATKEQLGGFSLNPSQQAPLNVFAPIAAIQDVLEQPHRANAILIASDDPATTAAPEAFDSLQKNLQPTLADYGLKFRDSELGYTSLESERLLVDAAAVEAAQKASGGGQEVFTYLANTLANGDREVPYSTISAIDFAQAPPLGPFKTAEGDPIKPLGAGEIALNTWAAEQLDAKVGDTIRLVYFDPESTHGVTTENEATLTLAAIVALEGPAADRGLTPTMPGVTDQLTIADWNPPFPFDQSRIRPEDEDYWTDYEATPKAFVSLETGRKLWSSRFGDTTSVRWPKGQAPQLSIAAEDMGFVFRPVKRQGLQASSGTTPFDGLFLGFSMFVIAAAVMLVGLLFGLAVDQRAREVGVLVAVGLGRSFARRTMLAEAAVVSIIGGLLGVALGVGYAWLMLTGLQTWWLAAIVTPFLKLHLTWRSAVIGFISIVVISLLAIAVSLRRLKSVSARRLLSGQTVDEQRRIDGPPRWNAPVAWGMIVAAVGLALFATTLGGEAQAGAFMGAGALTLAAALLSVWRHWRSTESKSVLSTGSAPIARLAWRNGSRHPGRSTLTVGLVAAASFVIVAVSAFRLESADPTDPRGGAGGYTLYAKSAQPIYQNLNTDTGRDELAFTDDASELWTGNENAVMAFRSHAGDDASCLNLYQPTQPRVLGAPQAFIERGGFSWAASAAETEAEEANPWLLLNKQLGADDAGREIIPVVLDQATALYSLKLYDGVGSRYVIQDERGDALTLEVVGLLKNSVLQGSLLISERAFVGAFPMSQGYRYFMISAPKAQIAEWETTLENVLSDQGFDVRTTESRLNDLLSVQNTYLSTFQSLGGLGLLLGTIGLAAAQMRSVLERRAELALFRAMGFRRSRLVRLVMFENGLLLVGGLAIGVLAALVAVAPQSLAGGVSVPWLTLLATFAVVLVVGLCVGFIASRAALRIPLVGALRD